MPSAADNRPLVMKCAECFQVHDLWHECPAELVRRAEAAEHGRDHYSEQLAQTQRKAEELEDACIMLRAAMRVVWRDVHGSHRACVSARECQMHPCPTIRVALDQALHVLETSGDKHAGQPEAPDA